MTKDREPLDLLSLIGMAWTSAYLEIMHESTLAGAIASRKVRRSPKAKFNKYG